MVMKQYVEIELDGKVKRLRFDFNAVADIETHFGKGIATIFNEENVGFNTIRAFYWAGLKWKDRGLTIERAGQMLGQKIEDEGIGVDKLMEPVLKALRLSGLIGKMEDIEDEADEVDEPKN